jgi:hypothetical protein
MTRVALSAKALRHVLMRTTMILPANAGGAYCHRSVVVYDQAYRGTVLADAVRSVKLFCQKGGIA